MLPLEIGDLFWQLSVAVAVIVQSNCVERVACCAKGRIAYLGGIAGNKSAGGSPHHLLMASIDHIRSMLGVLALSVRPIDDEIADEAAASSKILFRDLMAYRTGDAIRGLRITLFIRIKQKV